MLSGLLVIFIVVVCAALIGVVLLQRSEGGAFGMGGGPTGLITTRGAGDLLTRTTWVLFAVFIGLSLTLTLLGSHDHANSSLLERMKSEIVNPNALNRPAPATNAPTPDAGQAPAAPAPGANPFIAPQPTARRCFQFGQHIARVVAKSPWAVGIIATGGLSHFPELLLGRVGETDTVFDGKLIHLMERGEHEPLLDLTADELHKTGSHEFLNWMVLLGAITPARAEVRYFGELPRINLAAVEWRL